jgi:preprotein translocase subunit SecY
MKRFIDTLKNIWKIKELRNRILFTLGILLVFRIGSYVVLPGINPNLDPGSNEGEDGLLGMLDIFLGGSFSRMSIFALGIMPYISASIIMQVGGMAIPAIQKMQSDGESGRKKLNNWTRFLTIAMTCIQGPGYLMMQVNSADVAPLYNDPFWVAQSVLILTAGTIFVMWMGERITDKGIGNGISLLIMIGIIANLPAAFVSEMVSDKAAFMIIVELVALLVIIMLSVLILQAVRKIPVQYASTRTSGGKAVFEQGARQYIPIKLVAAGVMPIIFAQAIMMAPLYMGDSLPKMFSDLANPKSFLYNAISAVVIILFTYIYTAIIINPKKMADDLKRNNGFIPGVKQGTETADFFDNVISKITLPGSIFLAFIAILPAFAMIAGVKDNFAYFFGGTSLLIMVGVVLDTLQQIETHLLNMHYDGLIEGGKIKGRNDYSSVI